MVHFLFFELEREAPGYYPLPSDAHIYCLLDVLCNLLFLPLHLPSALSKLTALRIDVLVFEETLSFILDTIHLSLLSPIISFGSTTLVCSRLHPALLAAKGSLK